MKKLMYFGLFFCLHICIAQTDADYQNTMKTIIDSYNANDTQKVFDEFSTDLQATFTIEKLKEILTETFENQGKFSEFDLMDKDGGYRYLVQSENDSIILVIALSSDLKLTKFAVE